VKAYYRRGGITIYHADALDILPRLAGVGAVVTDSPYSSGGQYRGDRSQPTTTKYVQSQTKSYRAEFAGDNRDQRSYLAWAALWLNAARRASTPGALVVSFIDWRQLPTMTDAVQGRRLDLARDRAVVETLRPTARRRFFLGVRIRGLGIERTDARTQGVPGRDRRVHRARRTRRAST
jgi:DNA modification methylase